MTSGSRACPLSARLGSVRRLIGAAVKPVIGSSPDISTSEKKNDPYGNHRPGPHSKQPPPKKKTLRAFGCFQRALTLLALDCSEHVSQAPPTPNDLIGFQPGGRALKPSSLEATGGGSVSLTVGGHAQSSGAAIRPGFLSHQEHKGSRVPCECSSAWLDGKPRQSEVLEDWVCPILERPKNRGALLLLKAVLFIFILNMDAHV